MYISKLWRSTTQRNACGIYLSSPRKYLSAALRGDSLVEMVRVDLKSRLDCSGRVRIQSQSRHIDVLRVQIAKLNYR